MGEAQESESADQKTEKTKDDIEGSITSAMRARVGHFKEQADSLTLEGVRRLLEKDLGFEKFALDVHKRFIKQCLEECFGSHDNENVSKGSTDNMKEATNSEKEETKRSPEELEPKKEVKDHNSEDGDKMEGSPVLGLLTEGKTPNETEGSEVVESDVPSEEMIKKAVKKRAAHFRENSETLTMVGARRLLEEDLGLEKNSLDPYKKFISQLLDEVIQSPEIAKSANGVKKKKASRGKVSKRDTKGQSSESLDSGGGEVDEDEVKPKRGTAPKGRSRSSEVSKSHKSSAEETKASSNKRKRPVEPTSESGESSDIKDGQDFSEDGQSESSADEPVKKKREVSNNVYGKRVENLKSIIKSCGMSIPPSVYKRAKQAPENKRESYLIKELEEILAKEGLSTNPSEKEIKTVRKKKERAKELEGIDMSNIVSSSRRRSTASYVIPPKPQKAEIDSTEEEDDADGDDDDEDDEDDASDSEGMSEDAEDESD
ncbi:PREDICTED: HIRA-interacting protein 3 [Nelumbo nucifera]|uniref:HIRA-interacting protein 3 n=2 Tax=Nelumbo nucifera TaxID=4432 RepID=A0A1U8B111_NELNU|nr:PREDICTED: HIRA-interacting protein 3 [Nelumbo nucifera]DAD39624.1 TPA_asm: hypothetical protein HUJ06_013947 [Nelumbo nucifera]